MASLSNAVTIIVVFAILIQFLVDRVKELVGDKVMNIVKAPVWAVAFGALFALMFDIDFFALMGYSSQLPIIAKVITGLILSSGSTGVHELAPLMISRNRQQQKAGIVSERTGAMPRARLERTIRLNMQRLV